MGKVLGTALGGGCSPNRQTDCARMSKFGTNGQELGAPSAVSGCFCARRVGNALHALVNGSLNNTLLRWDWCTGLSVALRLCLLGSRFLLFVNTIHPVLSIR